LGFRVLGHVDQHKVLRLWRKCKMRQAVIPFCAVLLVILSGCGGGGATVSPEPMAIGWIPRADLGAPLYPAFSAVYDTFRVAPEFIELLRSSHEGVEVLVILGTWCGDSKRQVPVFLKVADEAGITADRIRLYGVDRSKKSPEGLEAPYVIERVPTFIFLKGGKEVGRITEKPVTTMEADMLEILARAAGS
jgi:thiol-disulfide isomerase/thioredoxin